MYNNVPATLYLIKKHKKFREVLRVLNMRV